MNIFDRYAPFVQDFIYRNNWQALRAIQVAAADAIFNTDDHLLLCASTASGKTEAAFFPILTLFSEDPPRSVGAIYIGPLKALINDQFLRLNDLCAEADIPVWHWHGDVPQSHKNRLLKNPSGILQITPESLEALLLHKHAAIARLFCDLRFVVIDEVHSLMRGDRGGQTLCLIQRLSRLAGVQPRRIGLSATIGDLASTGAYLASGTDRQTVIPKIEAKGLRWRLSMEHFYVEGPQAADNPFAARLAGQAVKEQAAPGRATPERVALEQRAASQDAPDGALSPAPDAEKKALPAPATEKSALPAPLTAASLTPAAVTEDAAASAAQPGSEVPARCGSDPPAPGLPPLAPASDSAPALADPGIGYIFAHTRDKKCLVFVNSREECEGVTTSLRQYCEARHEPDRFLIHHGNLSASYRETAEAAMRDDEQRMTTVTTATLELGIDIGRLERAFQIDAPFTVSSFLQRMGRTGRRDAAPEMWFVMREDPPEPRAMLPSTVPWKLLQGIALVQLYLEERWVEPPKLDRLPFSLLYHQTLATLAGSGELKPAQLASQVLSLAPFGRVTQQDYKLLLRHMLEEGQLQRTETGGLIVGLNGERQVNTFKFYAVFQENEEYTVRCGPQELGTIVLPPPAGEKIALAGQVWQVEEVDHKRHLVYCQPVKGKVPAYFGQCPGDIHTHILERMQRVLTEDTVYPYLMKNAVARLALARHTARNAGITQLPLVCLGGEMWCLFPWLGSYAFLALERFLKQKCADRLRLSGLEPSRPYFLQFKMKASPQTFFAVLAEEAARPIDPLSLVYPGELPLFEKYDEFLPEELVRRGFAYGILDIEGMRARIRQWSQRFLPDHS